MNKYAKQPDEIVDLHGYTTHEAGQLLDALLTEGYTHVRIIVGKGIHSKGGAVLRDFVKNYLHTNDINFSQSKFTDGGEGSLEVYF